MRLWASPIWQWRSTMAPSSLLAHNKWETRQRVVFLTLSCCTSGIVHHGRRHFLELWPSLPSHRENKERYPTLYRSWAKWRYEHFQESQQRKDHLIGRPNVLYETFTGWIVRLCTVTGYWRRALWSFVDGSATATSFLTGHSKCTNARHIATWNVLVDMGTMVCWETKQFKAVGVGHRNASC